MRPLWPYRPRTNINFSQIAREDDLAGLLQSAPIAMVEADTHRHALTFGLQQHGVQFCRTARAGQFEEHVFARRGGHFSHRGKLVVSDRDHYDVDLRVSDSGAPIGHYLSAGIEGGEFLSAVGHRVTADAYLTIVKCLSSSGADRSTADNGYGMRLMHSAKSFRDLRARFCVKCRCRCRRDRPRARGA